MHPPTSVRASLERILDDADEAASTNRELNELGRFLAEGKDPIVLFGAGYMGRQALRLLRNVGNHVVAFIDDRVELASKSFENVPVLPAEEVARRFPDALVLTTILQEHAGFSAIVSRLAKTGFSRVVPGTYLFCALKLTNPGIDAYFYIDLPKNVRAAREEILQAFSLLADARSQAEFVTQIKARLLLPYDGPPNEPLTEQYFTPGLFQPHTAETFVDCGAFDGDTLRGFLKARGNSFAKIWAFEPDPKNFKLLADCIASLDHGTATRVSAHEVAVGMADGTVYFDSLGTQEAAVGAHGASATPVSSVRLDTLLAAEIPTFVKMDIEGAELDALHGFAAVIRRARPVLAICVYHRQDHLWKVPLFLHSLWADYRFVLRSYMPGRLETVCFAVPPSRLI